MSSVSVSEATADGRTILTRLKDLLEADGSRGLSPLSSAQDYGTAAGMLRRGLRVAVVTGFFIPDAGAPETDGPLGSALIARAVERCGGYACVVTDPPCESVVRAAADVLGARVTVAVDEMVFTELEADVVVFCERPGAGADGLARSMRGHPVLGCASFDRILAPWTTRPWPVSIALGDGGNEAGMGVWRDIMTRRSPHFAVNLALSEALVALTADVSDWGAWALAGLCVTDSISSGLTAYELEAGLMALTAAGAVDGSTGRVSLSIDGYSLSECQKKLEAINECCGLLRYI